MNTTVRIPWVRNHTNEVYWNEVCAWAMEQFGLPGDKFEAHANVDYMDFVFYNKHDALIMCLKWNARMVTQDELTVELVGRLL